MLGQSRSAIWSMTLNMYSMAVFCCLSSPRRSRSGPMQAQTEPQASPFLSNSAFTCLGSICEVSSMGISTDWNPHFLNCGKSFVLSLVNGEVKRKVLIPNLISRFSHNLGKCRFHCQRVSKKPSFDDRSDKKSK